MNTIDRKGEHNSASDEPNAKEKHPSFIYHIGDGRVIIDGITYVNEQSSRVLSASEFNSIGKSTKKELTDTYIDEWASKEFPMERDRAIELAWCVKKYRDLLITTPSAAQSISVNEFSITKQLKNLVAQLVVADLMQMGIELDEYKQQEFQDNHSEDLIDAILDEMVSFLINKK